ncbi:hypothetical protein [Sphingobacterium paludis]|uniref:Outer membrane protein n=1 Tax=Sphingobacterium paludis TaxID=1476465 RepID=A0A4R7D4C7_9SPHI|nr:hypothetical protein [Sphingobacterium paludis]TDS13716.1 hypothetical protein B0I21_10442 [Sphingobacterium paludis]
MKNRFTYFAMMLISFLTFAATTMAVASEGERDSIPESAYEHGYPNPFALGVHVGTAGVGLHIYQPLGKHFGLRLGGSIMPFNTHITGNYSNRDLRSDVSAKANNVSLMVGWAPFSQNRGFFRSFNVQVGGAYFFDLNGKLTTRLAEHYTYGDIHVNPAVVGDITTNINWKETVNPYAGIGWSNIVLDSRFSVSIDLGAYYLSKPTVTMEATGLLEENVNNAATIQNNIQNYRYLPRVEVGFSYRFW